MSWLQACLDWASEKIVKPIVNGIEMFVGDIDMTITVGFSVSASLGLWTYSASVGVSMDFEGNVGIQGSVGVGLTTGGISAGVSGFATITNAPTIYALEGDSTQIGVGFSAMGAGMNIGGVLFESGNQTYHGVSASIGAALPHVEGTITISDTVPIQYSRASIKTLSGKHEMKGIYRSARGERLNKSPSFSAVCMD